MKRIVYSSLLVFMMFSACSTQNDVEGTWKNGDGNLIRFDDSGKAWLGQEGFPDEDECTYAMVGDTIVISTLPEGGDSLYNTYRMMLGGDTLRFVVFGLHATGMEQRMPIEEFAKRSGKPMDKLAFVKTKGAQ